MIAATGAEDETVVTIEGVEGNFIEVDQSATVVKATGGHSATPFGANDPTYESDGNKAYWYCDECKQYFLEEACETPVDYDEDIVIPKLTIEVKDTSGYTEETVDSLNTIILPNPSNMSGTTVESFVDNLEDGQTYVVKNTDGEIVTSGPIGTNFTVEIDGHPSTRVTVIVRGDLDCDGEISAMDYVKIKNHMRGAKLITDPVILLAADANGDGDEIGALDYVRVKNIMRKGK